MRKNSSINYLLNNLQILRFRNTKEEVTLNKIVYPLIELAGHDTIDIQSVEEEYDAQTGDSIHPIEIDICLKNNGNPVAFVQCKQIRSANKFRYDYEKTFKAAKLNKIPYIVFTDGLYWKIYKLDSLDHEYEIIDLRFDHFQYQRIVRVLQDIKEGVYG